MAQVGQITNCYSCFANLAKFKTHEETYNGYETTYPLPLCDKCVDNPARMDIHVCNASVFNSGLPLLEMQALSLALMQNKTERYLSLVGVVICILVMETGEDYFDVMLVNRKDKPADDSLSLVAGFMEQKHRTGAGAATAEIDEEADVLLDPLGPIHPFDWSTNPSNTLTLNCIVIHPDAVLGVCEFTEDNEVSGRTVFRVQKDVLPDLCIPIHNTFLKRLHDEFFLGNKPVYQWW